LNETALVVPGTNRTQEIVKIDRDLRARSERNRMPEVVRQIFSVAVEKASKAKFNAIALSLLSDPTHRRGQRHGACLWMKREQPSQQDEIVYSSAPSSLREEWRNVRQRSKRVVESLAESSQRRSVFRPGESLKIVDEWIQLSFSHASPP